jgi:hypothetical protein
MLTILGGLAEFDRTLMRARTGEGRELRRCPGGPGGEWEDEPDLI